MDRQSRTERFRMKAHEHASGRIVLEGVGECDAGNRLIPDRAGNAADL